MRSTLILLFALGCTAREPDTAIAPEPDTDTDMDSPVPGPCPADAPPTDTIPSFCGRVPKNLLVLSVDTFGKRYMGRYGDLGLTPFLDKLAEQGFALDDHAQCSNWTFGSVTCTALGRYNWEADYVAKMAPNHRAPLPDGTPTLATALAGAGFHNILVSSNAWLGSKWNNDQGFDVSFHQGQRVPATWAGARQALQEAQAEGVADRWFLHAHFIDPHSPYDAPDAYNVGYEDLEPLPWDLKRHNEHYDAVAAWRDLPEDQRALLEAHLRVLYQGEIRYTDALLKEVWAELEDLGWLDDSLVLFWADHGEAFWEHGAATHAHWLYAEENDGIAFFWARNIVPGSWSEPTVSIDLAPTLLSLFGLPIPQEMTGFPVGQAPPERVRLAAAYARKGVVQSARKGPHRLQLRWATGEVVLTDTLADPAEQVNLFDPAAPTAEALELWEALQPVTAELQRLSPERSVTWPEGLPTPGR